MKPTTIIVIIINRYTKLQAKAGQYIMANIQVWANYLYKNLNIVNNVIENTYAFPMFCIC